MPAVGGRSSFGWAGGSIILAAAIVVGAALPPSAGVGVVELRIATLILAGILLAAIVHADRTTLLLAPSLWLGLWAGGLYVWAPALLLLLYQTAPAIFTGAMTSRDMANVQAWDGSTAERLVIASSAAAFSTVAIVLLFISRKAIRDRPLPPYLSLLLIISLVVATGLVAIKACAVQPGVAMPGLLQNVLDGALPALSFSQALSMSAWITYRRFGLFLALNVALVAVTAIALETHKLPTLIILVAAILPIALAPQRISRGILGFVLAAIAAVAMLVLVTNLKPQFSEHPRLLIVEPVVQKIWARQVDTGACLQSVLERQATSHPSHGPGYFLAGLVPRFLWPDKPSLSQGSTYAIRFCGRQESDIVSRAPHSSSITLLGEPLVEAGVSGLIVGLAALLIALGVLSWGILVGGLYTRTLVAALLPWLSDFDQSLTFYVANSTKAAIYMSIILAFAVAIRHIAYPKRHPLSSTS